MDPSLLVAVVIIILSRRKPITAHSFQVPEPSAPGADTEHIAA